MWLAEQGLKVTAFDVSPVGVEKARKLAASRGVEVDFGIASIHEYDWGARRYDVIAGIFFQFADPQERARIFAGLRRSLAPGGLLLLQGYTPRQIEYKTGGPPHAENLYTEPMLREAFAGLEILHLAEHDDVVDEGRDTAACRPSSTWWRALRRRPPTKESPMNEAVIVSTARTPLCKSWRGALNMTHGATMGGHAVQAAHRPRAASIRARSRT